ncbi:MAG: hypothetical protein HY726_02865 [Candidatus Rokubacteria bacterium]|nr:hypothetical protein [Candidatus Rokubacteria bacterium]
MRRIGPAAGSVLALLVLLVLFLSPPPAWSEAWKEAYLKGLDLMDAQKWEEAVQAFEKAIQANPRENKSVRLYGMRYGYFPHRDKGIALYRLGRWEAATQALGESLRQGFSEEAARYAELARKRQPIVELPRVFRGTWWDYYERGLLHSERGLWNLAVEDFRAALKGQSREERFARTYGVHFIEYFPVREMGVALYHEGQFKAAVQALERSLATAPTAKAAYYLNLARAALLRQSAPDRHPPQIKIGAPPDGLLTNLAKVEVHGTAESRNFVAGVEINGEPLLIETAAARLPFAQTVLLSPGQNLIEVVARDLVGNEAKATVGVLSDREGPVVEIERVARSAAGRIQLDGALYDNVRLGALMIDGRSIPLSGVTESKFSAEVRSGVDSVLIEAADAAGNLTRARLPIPPELRQPGAKRWPSVRLVAWGPAVPVFFHTREPLTIELEPVPTEVQQETMPISWIVAAVSGLAAVKINDEAKTVRQAEGAKPQIFSHILTLAEGENVFIIGAADRAGRTVSKKLTVVRKVEEVNQIGSRLSVAVMPFQHKGKPTEFYEGAYEAMVDALVNQGRFKIVSRVQLENILRELKLSRTELVDPATAVRVGKLAAAEAIMVATVAEYTREAETYVQLINTETSTVLASKDVFDPAKSPGSVQLKMRELAAKIRQDYPVVAGAVIAVRDRRVAVGLGSQKRVRPDMKVIVYLEGDPLIDPETKVVLDRNVELLAEGLLTEVRPQVSFADIKKGEELSRIERHVAQRKSLKVITK